MNLTFKQVFPSWEHFHEFLLDFSVYYDAEEYTTSKTLIYYTLLYREFGNSHMAYDRNVFLEQLSLNVAERFREFFKVRSLLDFINSKTEEELVKGIETISNVGEAPNMVTDKDTILDFIGVQNRTRSTENVVDRVWSIIPRIRIAEVKQEVNYYRPLFIQIIPRQDIFYGEGSEYDESQEDYAYKGRDRV